MEIMTLDHAARWLFEFYFERRPFPFDSDQSQHNHIYCTLSDFTLTNILHSWSILNLTMLYGCPYRYLALNLVNFVWFAVIRLVSDPPQILWLRWCVLQFKLTQLVAILHYDFFSVCRKCQQLKHCNILLRIRFIVYFVKLVSSQTRGKRNMMFICCYLC